MLKSMSAIPPKLQYFECGDKNLADFSATCQKLDFPKTKNTLPV
jgi:hypothetical protein